MPCWIIGPRSGKEREFRVGVRKIGYLHEMGWEFSVHYLVHIRMVRGS